MHTTVPMAITVGCNILNIFLNWVLIFGKLGAPQMGANGAALSTLLSRAVMPVAFTSIWPGIAVTDVIFCCSVRAILRVGVTGSCLR